MHNPDDDIRQAVEVVIRGLDGIAALHTARRNSILLPDTYGCDFTGKKYWRVWRQNWSMPYLCPDCKESQRQAYADGDLRLAVEVGQQCHHDIVPIEGQRFVSFFVQIDNGDVWKAGGWKKPALNFTRGNIASQNGRSDLFDHFLTNNYGW